MKKIKSLLLASVLTLGVVSNTVPFTMNVNAVEAGTYKLYKTVEVYNNASDAKAKINPIKTYAAGTYYIYREVDGMMNISRTNGAPGAWINPTSNIETAITTVEKIVTTEEKTSSTATKNVEAREDNANYSVSSFTSQNNIVVGGEITVLNGTSKFISANDALNGTNSTGTYTTGTYYIYKIYNGMLNVSKIKGTPGSWININAKVVSEPTITTEAKTTTVAVTKPATQASNVQNNVVNTQNNTVVLGKTTVVYSSVNDATNQINQSRTYAAGTYYIYKIYNGMYNISKISGVPGSWVNGNIFTKTQAPVVTTQATTKATTSATKSTTVPATTTAKTTSTTIPSSIVGTVYNLTAITPVYTYATDAKNLVNSVKTYPVGKYYVYKNVDGMLNISKTPGVPGAWINPANLKNIPTTTTTNTTKTTTNATKATTNATKATTSSTSTFPYPKTYDAANAIKLIAPIVKKYDDKGGMLNSVKIAQIIIESGALTSDLFRNANNPAGIKFSAPYSIDNPDLYYVKNSTEYLSSLVNSAFRKYPTVEDGIKDFSNFYTSSSYRTEHYAKALNATNYRDQANALTGVYATNPNYGASLIEVIEKYNLTQYD